MTPENFVYWLQGLMEIGNPESLNKEQIEIIKNHISLVLTKVTPLNLNGDIIVKNKFQHENKEQIPFWGSNINYSCVASC